MLTVNASTKRISNGRRTKSNSQSVHGCDYRLRRQRRWSDNIMALILRSRGGDDQLIHAWLDKCSPDCWHRSRLARLGAQFSAAPAAAAAAAAAVLVAAAASADVTSPTSRHTSLHGRIANESAFTLHSRTNRYFVHISLNGRTRFR